MGLDLWDLIESNANDAEVETTIEKFVRFHRDNPGVYRLFRNKARKLRRAGRTRYGARTIFESMRYNHDISTIGDDFKLNNNLIPMYARLLMLREPAWFGAFFELRTSRSDVTDADLLDISV